MSAAQLPLEIEQGSDCVFSIGVTGGPVSLSGFTGAMQIRGMKGQDPPLYTLDPSHITIDASGRVVTVRIPAAETAVFTWTRGVYDVRIKNTADATEAWRIAEGKITVDHWVTEE